MIAFADDPEHPGVRVWRRGAAGAIGSAFGTILIGVIALGFTAFAIVITATMKDVSFTAIIGAMSLFMWLLTAYVWRDWQGKRGGRIALSDARIDLDLAPNRSLIHRAPRCRRMLAWSQVSGVVTRQEAYASQTFATIQRPYWLTLRDGPPILLFEDRAIGSDLQTASYSPLAEEIAARGGFTIVQHGMAKGKGGILGVWFAHPPAFDAPDMDIAGQRRMWRAVYWTGAALGLVWALVILIQFVF